MIASRSCTAMTPSATPRSGSRWHLSSRSVPWRMTSLPTRWPNWCSMARALRLQKVKAPIRFQGRGARHTPPWRATAAVSRAPTPSEFFTAPMRPARQVPSPCGKAREPRCYLLTPSLIPSSFPGSNIATKTSSSSGWTANLMSLYRKRRVNWPMRTVRTTPRNCATCSRLPWPTTR